QIVLSNTYHLYLRPGHKVVEELGGLHGFMNWDGPILTDSGGYQVFSLARIREIRDDGVVFQSHIDGSSHLFTPEVVMDIQRALGADVAMAFDECTDYPCEYDYAKESMQLTHRWLDRCIEHFDKTKAVYDYHQSFFPIVQGSTFKDLRTESAETIASQNREGNAIGGLSTGEPHEIMYEMTEVVCDILPENKPRYLMGVGNPENILECIALGVDMFDCVMPTRNGRNGMLFTSNGIINIRNKQWENDHSAIDADSDLPLSNKYSKAYLRHLIISKEILGLQLASIHNLSFYLWLVRKAREKIEAGTFAKWKNKMVKRLGQRL
ncbi:MAG: tRNA guanosine(34) transglycosylase Tgt, partial [Bacteroidetes bacterium]|nr:tRNA guanosine(34) transglycosylase Tgt [Bacteroidota bacterium]